LLFQTFIGNQVTCLKILPQQIQSIVELAALHLEKVPEFLDLLNDIVKVSDLGLTLKRNQAYVMKFLMQVNLLTPPPAGLIPFSEIAVKNTVVEYNEL